MRIVVIAAAVVAVIIAAFILLGMVAFSEAGRTMKELEEWRD